MNIQSLPKLVTLSIIILFISYSCSQNKRNTGKEEINSTLQIPYSKKNDSLVVELGDSIQNAIQNGDVDKYLSYYDLDSFSSFITKDTPLDNKSAQYKDGFLKGVKSGLKSIPQKIIDEVSLEGYYDFVNYFYDESTQTYYMLFRLYSSLSGINYHQYRVSKQDDKLTFSDIYIYLTGENLSETFKRLFIYSLPKKSLFDFFGENNSSEFLKIAEATKLYNQGKFQMAYHKFNDIKGDLKNDKFILILKSTCASQINDREYSKTMQQIVSHYPDDPTLYLSQIDYYIITKNYEKTIELLNRLENETSDDFLNFLKGNLELERSNYSKAIEHFKYIIDNYPDFSEGYTTYLYALSLNGDFDKCIDLLSFLTNNDYLKPDLIQFIEEEDEYGQNEFKALINSKQYKNWKKS